MKSSHKYHGIANTGDLGAHTVAETVETLGNATQGMWKLVPLKKPRKKPGTANTGDVEAGTTEGT